MSPCSSRFLVRGLQATARAGDCSDGERTSPRIAGERGLRRGINRECDTTGAGADGARRKLHVPNGCSAVLSRSRLECSPDGERPYVFSRDRWPRAPRAFVRMRVVRRRRRIVSVGREPIRVRGDRCDHDRRMHPPLARPLSPNVPTWSVASGWRISCVGRGDERCLP